MTLLVHGWKKRNRNRGSEDTLCNILISTDTNLMDFAHEESFISNHIQIYT
jgi:hypothetical protein